MSASVKVPTFRIVALGAQGSGKTVYLASLFKELQLPGEGRSWSLDASLEDRRYLGHTYSQIADPAAKWPVGTALGDMRKFAFDCIARDGNERHRLLQLSYLDYAGELLGIEEAPGEKVATLETHIQSAHALLGILDGVKVAQYLRGDPAGRRYFQAEMIPMVGALANASCPVQFVITKWDLLTDIGEPPGASHEVRLAIVRDALFGNPEFAGLTAACSEEGRVLRLIPVSAVGDGFAALDDTGRVTKIKSAKAESYNLAAPLAAVVPDFFELIGPELSAGDRSRIEWFVSRRLRGKWVPSAMMLVRALRRTARVSINAIAQASSSGVLTAPLLDLVFDWVTSKGLSTTDRDRADGSSLHRARSGVLDEFEKTVWGLEHELPSSVLSRGGW